MTCPDDEVEEVVLATTGAGVAPDLVVGPGAHPEYESIGDPVWRFKVWVGSGVDDTDYTVSFLATTVEGRVLDGDMLIKVRD